MPSGLTLKRLQNLVWILIYGGLLLLVLSLFLPPQERITAAILQVAGVLGVLFGVVLIYVRSRLSETPED
jgi:hypothetical protein